MRGFFGFAVILAMITTLIFFSAAIYENTTKTKEIINELIKAEEANKEKTLLENNVDKIIHTKLEEQIKKNNYNIKKAQTEINTALEAYLLNKADVTTPAHEKIGKATRDQLNNQSKVTILQSEEGAYAEYVYTSNPQRSLIVSKKLGNEIITYFTIPLGQTTRIIKLII
jgi:hypothetical protein